MTAREEILNAIRRHKPEETPLPVIPVFDRADIDSDGLVKTFRETLIKIGGSFKKLPTTDELAAYIDEIHPGKQKTISTVRAYEGTCSISALTRPLDLEDVDLAILQGGIAVAENASVWISDEAIVFRALPFICQHLVLVFSACDLVYNMHQAYQKILLRDRHYGVFIAGPSKTADIEQSLVIGAHGPRSMAAVMIG